MPWGILSVLHLYTGLYINIYIGCKVQPLYVYVCCTLTSLDMYVPFDVWGLSMVASGLSVCVTLQRLLMGMCVQHTYIYGELLRG